MNTQLTASEKLQFVEDKIRDLLPRLKKLSFGCDIGNGDILIHEKKDLIRNWDTGGFIRRHYCHIFDSENEEPYINEEALNGLKIIGHPIRLEDVLEAIDPWGNWGVVAGHIARIDRKKSEYSMKVKWQYGKPLSGQSEEFINFLYNLLK